MAKERLDVLLVEKGLVSSRERAKTTIMSGLVVVDGQKIDKPGTQVKVEAELRVLGNTVPYVSRGGLKLEKAIKTFNVSLQGKIMADIGASTGGFTDCSLQNGAIKVYAIDVGYGQLAWKLRNDDRVINMERTNIRFVTPDMLQEQIDFASIDVAFISLTKVLSVAKSLLQPQGEIVALIKPQFEAGKERVGKKGVVKDPAVHLDVVKQILKYCQEINLYPLGLTFSPVKGPEGNIEYLLWLANDKRETEPVTEILAELVVRQAHAELDK